MRRGTEMVFLLENEDVPIKWGELVDKFFCKQFDPIIEDKSPMMALKVLDVLFESCKQPLFDINAEYNGEQRKIERIDLCGKLGGGAEVSADKKYQYKISDSLGEVSLWSKPDNVFITVYLTKETERRITYYFKGTEVDGIRRHSDCFYNLEVDIHGFEARGSLSLNREDLTSHCLKRLNSLVSEHNGYNEEQALGQRFYYVSS